VLNSSEVVAWAVTTLCLVFAINQHMQLRRVERLGWLRARALALFLEVEREAPATSNLGKLATVLVRLQRTADKNDLAEVTTHESLAAWLADLRRLAFGDLTAKEKGREKT